MHTAGRVAAIAFLFLFTSGGAALALDAAPNPAQAGSKATLDPATPGYLLFLENAVAPTGAAVHIPVKLFRGRVTGAAPSVAAWSVSYDPSVLEFANVQPSAQLVLWYHKAMQGLVLRPGLVVIGLAGTDSFEMTTFDDQRPRGNASRQNNPFAMGDLVFNVIGETGSRSPLELSEVGWLSGAGKVLPSYTEDAGFVAGSDTDGDGMSDAFEQQYDLNPNYPGDAGLNPDGDALTNLQEFLVGSNPRVADVQNTFYVSTTGSDTGGDGTSSNPWRSVGHAMSAAAGVAFPFNHVTIFLGPGVYNERVVLEPYVTVAGAGRDATTISWYNPDESVHNVVVGASNSGLRDCRVTVPGSTGAPFSLIEIYRVVTTVKNVDADGNGQAASIGVHVVGDVSSGSLITDSVIHKLDIGLQAVNSGVTVARTLFEDIASVAVDVEPPEGKADQAFVAPLLGDHNRPDTTGLNRFRVDAPGLLVLNNNPAEMLSEINDWGLYSEEEIAGQMSGPVNFTNFVQKSLGPSSVAVTVKNGATGLILPATTVASVSIPSLSLDADHDEGSNLYVFDAVPAGHQLIRASATGIGTGETFVDTDGLGVKAAQVTLSNGNGGGCGKMASTNPAQRRSAAFGSLWINGLVVLSLSVYALVGRKRR